MSESRTISRHAGTVLAGQLAVMAFGVTDTLVAGRHSDQALAALSVGSAIYISVYVALMGIVQALLPIWSELHGKRDSAALGRSVHQALYLCGLTMLLGMALLLSPGPLLRWTAVPAPLQEAVRDYLSILAVALPPALLFRMYSTFNQSLGKPQLVTWLQIGALFAKVPLSVWLAFGGAGLPALGAAGCAWATLVVNILMLAVALRMLRTRPFYQPYALWRRPERPDWRQLAAFARMGVPAGLAILVEVTSFTLMALYIARQGTTSSAAHQIAASLAAVLYMVPLSVAIATSARVGFWLGAGNAAAARNAVFKGFRLLALSASALSAIVLIASDSIARVYSDNTAVIALASGLIGWVAVFHAADAVQAFCIFVTRCYHVTVAPLVVYCVLLWGVGLGGGYVLAYHGVPGWLPPQPSPRTFWIAAAAALALTAGVFVLLLRQALRRAAR